MRRVGHLSETEPGARSLSGAPLEWRRTVIFDNREAPTFTIQKVLVGVRWPCPRCHQGTSVALMVRKRRGFKFRCTILSCRWREPYSFLRAFEMIDAYGLPRP